MVRGAMNHFGRIQGGETGKSPKRALTVEPTPKSPKIIVAQRVARLLAKKSVALTRRDLCGYRLAIAPSSWPKYAATPHARVFQQPANLA
jgi:hypothetical protein